MEDKINLFKELQTNKDILNSSSSLQSEQIDAFRKQAILLDQVSQSFSEVERFSIYRSFLKDQNTDDEYYKAYLLERSKNVEEMLRDFPRSSAGVEMYVDSLLVNKNLEDSGKYRANAIDEVSAKDLQMFRNILGGVPSSQLVEPSKRDFQSFSGSSEYDNGRQTTLNQFLFRKPLTDGKGPSTSGFSGFRTAREELVLQNLKKTEAPSGSSTSRALFNYGAAKKSLGARRNVRSEFVPPIRPEDKAMNPINPIHKTIGNTAADERLRNIEPKMIELITNEIMHKFKPISWDDIAGLEYSKSTIKEAVVWPLLRPDIFTGLRRPPRGILLFGPPGTGKTLIGKCIASQSKSTFFSISASSLTSKWVGDGEKMVRALFAVAAFHQPSVVFIDEIDSLLSQRSETEHESSRRLKNEFLVQLDGASTSEDERILTVAATNRPQELDEAARRRLTRRLYIPLPELPARIQILTKLLQTVRNQLTEDEIAEIGQSTEGYSGADVETLCREASLEPIRTIPAEEIPYFDVENLRPVALEDFHSALQRVRPSVSKADMRQYEDWNRDFGAGQ